MVIKSSLSMVRYLLLALLAIGCSPCREVMTSQRDSLSVELRTRYVTAIDTLHFEIPRLSERVVVRSDSSLLESDFARSEAILRPNGELYHTLETTPHSIEQRHIYTHEVRDSIVYRDRVEVRTIEVERKLSWWQRLQIKGFWTCAALILGGVLIRRLLG